MKKRTAPETTTQIAPFAGIEDDASAIEAAMQELGLAIVESGGDVFGLFDEWPKGKPKGDLAQMIVRPTTTAFRMAWVTLEKHLLTVAGEATLKAARDRIAAVVRASIIPEATSTKRTLQ